MTYEKCRECPYACRCCASHFLEVWARCQSCPRYKTEFEPAAHIKRCPLDGQKIKRPLFDVNGRIVMED